MPKRRLRRILISLVIATASALTYYLQTHPAAQQATSGARVLGVQQPGYYHVVHVTDGDTIAVDMNGKRENIRMIGVDTPESVKPNSPMQCYGKEASDFSKRTLSDQTVRLEADPAGDNRDRYDRLLRYVYLQDGTLWNQKLITDGYGFAYLSFPFSKQADFAAAQARAQDAKLGLWATCKPVLSTGGRWQSNNLN
jgi:endonuclease YncB( thermonuclease family)